VCTSINSFLMPRPFLLGGGDKEWCIVSITSRFDSRPACARSRQRGSTHQVLVCPEGDLPSFCDHISINSSRHQAAQRLHRVQA
jgi:hypothetical protein